tara:strand:+ start:66 stop:251 length:186 start_codon:yes stop_codon:yes gene_type:complete
MKITLEPTYPSFEASTTSPTVIIELPFDDLDIEEVMDHLIKPALISYGFLSETIDTYFEEY